MPQVTIIDYLLIAVCALLFVVLIASLVLLGRLTHPTSRESSLSVSRALARLREWAGSFLVSPTNIPIDRKLFVVPPAPMSVIQVPVLINVGQADAEDTLKSIEQAASDIIVGRRLKITI